jgi:hypothetical protein
MDEEAEAVVVFWLLFGVKDEDGRDLVDRSYTLTILEEVGETCGAGVGFAFGVAAIIAFLISLRLCAESGSSSEESPAAVNGPLRREDAK